MNDKIISEEGIKALETIFIPGSNKYFNIKPIIKNIIESGKNLVLKTNKKHYSWEVIERNDDMILHIFKEDKSYDIFMSKNNTHSGLVYNCTRKEPKYYIENLLFFDTKMVNSNEYFYNPRCDIRTYALYDYPEIENNFCVSLVFDEETEEIKTVSDFSYDDEKYTKNLEKFINDNKFDKNITKWSEEELFYFSLKCPEFVK